MRHAKLNLTGLGLIAACARPPSAAPLGGKEWVPPEQHSDRRSHSSDDGSSRKAESAETTAPNPEAAPAASAKAAPITIEAKSSESGEIRFGPRRFSTGSSITLTTRYTLHAAISVGSASPADAARLDFDGRERIEVRVLDAAEDQLREVEVSYLESEATFSPSLGPSPADSNKGKRYRVNFRSAAPRVTAIGRSLDGDEQKGVLFDLATVSGYLPLVRPHLPASLALGWSTKLGAAELSRVFGTFDALKMDGSWLNLRAVNAERSVAQFDCGLPVHFEREGLAFSVDLKGTCSARVANSSPLEVSLQGPLRAEFNSSAEASISGSLEARLTHEYSP